MRLRARLQDDSARGSFTEGRIEALGGCRELAFPEQAPLGPDRHVGRGLAAQIDADRAGGRASRDRGVAWL